MKIFTRIIRKLEFTLSVADLPPGVYIYTMDDGSTLKSGKLMIE